MKNKLKIYNIDPKKKYDLSKKFHKLVIVTMMISSLTACGKKNDLDYNNKEYKNEYQNTLPKENDIKEEPINKDLNSSNNFNYYHEKDDNEKIETNEEVKVQQEIEVVEPKVEYDQEYLNNIANMQIKLDSKSTSYLYDLINDINVTYPNEELFDIDSSLARYNQLQLESVSTSSINFSLYDIVKKNNQDFLTTYSGNKYKNLSDSTLMNVCDLLTESINCELQSGNVKVPNIEEKLKQLKIFDFDEFTYAFYNQNDGLLGISLKAINSLNKDNAFNRVIYHEGKHIVQASYNNNPNIDMQFGFLCKWKDLKVNSMFNEWFYETSAEQLVLNQTDSKEPIVYDNGLRCFDTIKVATLLNDKNNINSLENLTLQNDINELYNYFNYQNEEEKKEILNMMFAYNILISTGSNTTTGDFYNKYVETCGSKMTVSDQTHYGYELTGSISTTLSKVFYKDLISKIENKQVNLNEIFSLITVFETELNKQCRYYENTKIEYLGDFFENYSNIQDGLFESIASSLNITMDEVKEAYNTYFKNYNYQESLLLNTDKNIKYSEIYNKDMNFKENTINYYKNLYYGEDVKKTGHKK